MDKQDDPIPTWAIIAGSLAISLFLLGGVGYVGHIYLWRPFIKTEEMFDKIRATHKPEDGWSRKELRGPPINFGNPLSPLFGQAAIIVARKQIGPNSYRVHSISQNYFRQGVSIDGSLYYADCARQQYYSVTYSDYDRSRLRALRQNPHLPIPESPKEINGTQFEAMAKTLGLVSERNENPFSSSILFSTPKHTCEWDEYGAKGGLVADVPTPVAFTRPPEEQTAQTSVRDMMDRLRRSTLQQRELNRSSPDRRATPMAGNEQAKQKTFESDLPPLVTDYPADFAFHYNGMRWDLSGPHPGQSPEINQTDTVLSENGDYRYTWTRNGLVERNIQKNEEQLFELPADYPKMSGFRGLAYNNDEDVVALVSIGGEGHIYVFDAKGKSWIGVKSMNDIDMNSLTYNPYTKRYASPVQPFGSRDWFVIEVDGNTGAAVRYPMDIPELNELVQKHGRPGVQANLLALPAKDGFSILYEQRDRSIQRRLGNLDPTSIPIAPEVLLARQTIEKTPEELRKERQELAGLVKGIWCLPHSTGHGSMTFRGTVAE